MIGGQHQILNIQPKKSETKKNRVSTSHVSIFMILSVGFNLYAQVISLKYNKSF